MIVLFTDFGLEGPYTGQVDAVLHETAPAVPVDLVCSPMRRPDSRSPRPICWPRMPRGFPPARVLLCVVDPGVGSERGALIVEADGRRYVGPDNGLFELVLRRAAAAAVLGDRLAAAARCRRAFTAATCSRRSRRGWRAARRRRLARPRSRGTRAQPDWPDDLAEIVYIDRYGNALTGLRGESPAPSARLRRRRAGGRRVPRPSRRCRQARAFWYVNSNGLVEIAVNGGRADRALGLADRQRRHEMRQLSRSGRRQ